MLFLKPKLDDDLFHFFGSTRTVGVETAPFPSFKRFGKEASGNMTRTAWSVARSSNTWPERRSADILPNRNTLDRMGLLGTG